MAILSPQDSYRQTTSRNECKKTAFPCAFFLCLETQHNKRQAKLLKRHKTNFGAGYLSPIPPSSPCLRLSPFSSLSFLCCPLPLLAAFLFSLDGFTWDLMRPSVGRPPVVPCAHAHPSPTPRPNPVVVCFCPSPYLLAMFRVGCVLPLSWPC